MADISITPANVVQGAAAGVETGIAGETITAGMAVYKDSSGNYMKADCDSATALARVARGIALHGASLSQPLAIQKSGDMTIGGTLTGGLAYYLSKTAGGICPVADIATGGYPCIVGIAQSTSVLRLVMSASPIVQ